MLGGGAYAILGWVNQQAVEAYGWVTQADAIAGLALAETTPGPLIMVLQFIGYMAGWHASDGSAATGSVRPCFGEALRLPPPSESASSPPPGRSSAW